MCVCACVRECACACVCVSVFEAYVKHDEIVAYKVRVCLVDTCACVFVSHVCVNGTFVCVLELAILNSCSSLC